MEVTGIALVLVFVVIGVFILPVIISSRRVAADSRTGDRFSPNIRTLDTDVLFDEDCHSLPRHEGHIVSTIGGREAMSSPTLDKARTISDPKAQSLEEKRLTAIKLRQKAAQRRLVLFGIEVLATIIVGVVAFMSLISTWYVLIPVVLMGATLGLGRKATVDGLKADERMKEKISELNGDTPVTDGDVNFPKRHTFTPTEIKWTTRSTNVSAVTGQLVDQKPKVVWRSTDDAGEVDLVDTDTQADVATDAATDAVADAATDAAADAVADAATDVATDVATEATADAIAPAPSAEDHKAAIESDSRGRWEPQSLPKPLYAMKEDLGRRDVTTGAIRMVNGTDDDARVSDIFRPSQLSFDAGITMTSEELAGNTFDHLDEILDRRRAL